MKFLILALSVSTVLFLGMDVSNANTCYKQVGGACVSSSTGNMDSTCTNPCAVSNKSPTAAKHHQKTK